MPAGSLSVLCNLGGSGGTLSRGGHTEVYLAQTQKLRMQNVLIT